MKTVGTCQIQGKENKKAAFNLTVATFFADTFELVHHFLMVTAVLNMSAPRLNKQHP